MKIHDSMTKDYLGITNNDRTILDELRHQNHVSSHSSHSFNGLQPNCVSVSVRPQHSFVSVDEGAHPNPRVRLCMEIPANPASFSLFGIISLYLKLPPTLLPQTTRLPFFIMNCPSTVHHYHYGNIQTYSNYSFCITWDYIAVSVLRSHAGTCTQEAAESLAKTQPTGLPWILNQPW